MKKYGKMVETLMKIHYDSLNEKDKRRYAAKNPLVQTNTPHIANLGPKNSRIS